MIQGRMVFDLCAGNGILGLGALKIGSSSVVLVETDPERSRCSARNAEKMSEKVREIETTWRQLGTHPVIQEIEEGSVIVATCHIDGPAVWTMNEAVVLMNPPFGTVIKGSDRAPIKAAWAMKPRMVEIMHSRHATHLKSLVESSGYLAERRFNAEFDLPRQAEHHVSERSHTDVSVWRCVPQRSML